MRMLFNKHTCKHPHEIEFEPSVACHSATWISARFCLPRQPGKWPPFSFQQEDQCRRLADGNQKRNCKQSSPAARRDVISACVREHTCAPAIHAWKTNAAAAWSAKVLECTQSAHGELLVYIGTVFSLKKPAVSSLEGRDRDANSTNGTTVRAAATTCARPIIAILKVATAFPSAAF